MKALSIMFQNCLYCARSLAWVKEARNLDCSLNLSCVATVTTEQPFLNADRNLKIQSSTQVYRPVHEICRCQGFSIP